MGTLQEGLASPTTGTQSQRRMATPAAPAATKQSVTDVVALALKGLEATRTRSERQKADVADAAEQEKVAEQVAELYLGDVKLTVELTQLNKERGHAPRGSVRAEEIRNEIDQKTALQGTVKLALEALRVSNPSAHTDGARRYGRRQEAAQMASANREVSATPENIRSRITGAVEAGFSMELTPPEQEAEYKRRDWATVSFDRKTYGPVKPEDPAEADVTVSLAEMVADLQERKQDDNNKIIVELVRGGFYISARRDPDGKGSQLPSELDLLRDEIRDEVRRQTGDKRRERWEPSEFLAGNGQRYVARVGGPLDFVVLENRDGDFFAVKASSARAGRFLFTRPDRQAGEGARVAAKTAPKINQAGTTVTATDISGVADNQLRRALEEDLRRETESAERREVANELRDLSDVPDPITTYALSQKQAGTSVVDAKIGDQKAGEREEHITMRLTGDGNGTFVISQHIPGTIEKVDPKKCWLARAFDKNGQPIPMSVEVFKRVEGWRELLRSNAWHDRNWQLARKAKEVGATVVTTDNVADLTSVSRGKDGLYAFGVQDYRSNEHNPHRRPTDPIETWSVPLGFIVKREGQTITPVYGVPGPSANKLEKIGGAQSIAALTPVFRAILRNLLFAVAPRENGQRVRVEVPEHLTSVKQ